MTPIIPDDTRVEVAAEQVLAEARRVRGNAEAFFRGCIMLAEPHWTVDRVLTVWQYAATHRWVMLGRRLEELHAAGVHAVIGTRGGEWFVEIERLGRFAEADEAAGIDELAALTMHLEQLRRLVLGRGGEGQS
jgi:hypothetical protein